MLIPLNGFLEKHKINIGGVVHVGAHWAEEHQAYLACGIKKMVYIEPCAAPFQKLSGMFAGNSAVTLIQCACGEFSGVQEMNTETSNQGQSNSLLAPKLHLVQHPEVVFNSKQLIEIRRLDDLAFDRSQYNMLMMDCQGYEAHVLKGAKETLKNFKLVYTEVNKDYLYEGCALVGELDQLLSDFTRVETSWCGNTDWGDAIYVRN